eukprot:XP_001692093.1 predicted protein [Chlamydomonas reinhardtii]
MCVRLARSGPALSGLTRLCVCEYQSGTQANPLVTRRHPSTPGSTPELLEVVAGLARLAHLGLSGLDDTPYIHDGHMELLVRLPALRHLAVDRLDLSSPPPLWALTGLEVALVAHSAPRLQHVFPGVVSLQLRWLWEQAMRRLAGWTSLTSLSLSNLDCCLDWGLLRTLSSLTHLQLCRGSSYEQLAELLYLLRALPRLSVLRLSGWHCMRQGEPGRLALGVTRGLGLGLGSWLGQGGAGAGAAPMAAAAPVLLRQLRRPLRRWIQTFTGPGAASGCWVDGEALLRLRLLRERGIDVMERR